MRTPRDRNLGRRPGDPEYDDGFDYGAELDRYDAACEERAERERETRTH